MELGRLIHELQDAFGSGAVESAVELVNGGCELEAIASGGGQCRRTVLLMLIEVAEAGSGGGFGVAGAEELLASGVELIGASADGDLVASGPTAGELLVERGLGRGDVLFGSSASAGGGARLGAGVVAVVAEIWRQRSFDGDELAGQVLAADAQRFDAVGEGLVGADADERDVGPVLVEPFPRVVDRAATPAVLLLVAIVGGLLTGEAFDASLSGSDGPGGIDRRWPGGR